MIEKSSGTSAAAPAAEASGAAEIGNGDAAADVEVSNTEHEQGKSDAVARKDGECQWFRGLLCNRWSIFTSSMDKALS